MSMFYPTPHVVNHTLTSIMRALTLRSVTLALLLAAAVATITKSGKDATTTAAPTQPAPGLAAEWNATFPAKFYGLPNFDWLSVFVCADATVLALDRRNGTIQWKATVESPCQYVAVGDGRIYVGSDNSITAFDARGGDQKWRHNFTGGSAGNPARPTYVDWGKVAFTVENGQMSQPFTVLRAETGEVLFKAPQLATTRLWFTDRKLIYQEVPSKNDSTLSLVARDVDHGFMYSWKLNNSAEFPLSAGGAVAFEGSPVLCMLSPPNAIAVGTVDTKTGKPTGVMRNFSSATNNFDFTLGVDSFFTIESVGAPSYATAIFSAFDLKSGNQTWTHNVTLGSPNLLPGWGQKPVIFAQGAQGLVEMDQQSGAQLSDLAFPNPQFVIGDAAVGQLVIGNTVEGRVYSFRYV
jgi:outer membrane protein assembly factor BamB